MTHGEPHRLGSAATSLCGKRGLNDENAAVPVLHAVRNRAPVMPSTNDGMTGTRVDAQRLGRSSDAAARAPEALEGALGAAWGFCA